MAGKSKGTDRGAGDVRPLITADEMYPALENMVLDAEREVVMSFRIFDAETRLRSETARERGLESWADLLVDAVERGVKVYILMADFDPLFTTKLHRSAWASARAFAEADDRLAIRLTPHGARLGLLWQTAFRSQIRSRLDGLEDGDGYTDTPVLERTKAGEIAVRPVSLHQKFAVIDGERAVLGGLDIDERRYDDREHDQPAPQTWHDVSLAVSGPIAGVIRSHFLDCWDYAEEDGAAVFGTDATPERDDAPQEDTGPIRLLRTVSRPRTGPLAFAPQTLHSEPETAHAHAFRHACRGVYIETQFFRHIPLARALASAAAEEHDLQLIIVMPTEPERIVFGGDDGIDARHAQALQLRCIDILRGAFGDRLALISPAKPEPTNGNEGQPLGGAGIVYVHAKVTLVDDDLAIVGSANLNGRSMRWDTEAALEVRESTLARGLRRSLARHWLGAEVADKDIGRAETWNRAARRNAECAPEDRQGFAMPYPMTRTRRFSIYTPFLPANMF